MPNQELSVSLIGVLDEERTIKTLEGQVDEVGKVVGKKKSIKIQAFDIDQLNRDGIRYIQGLDKVKSKIKDLYREAGDKINIKGIKDINGETIKYMATVTKANQIVAQFNLEKAKIGDGFGFVQTGGGFTDKSLGSELTKQVNTLNKYKADVEKILNDYVRVNGSRLLGNGSHFNTIKDSAVNIIQNINNLSKTAGANTDQQMDGIKKVVDALKLEADEYYRIEKNQKKLIDSQTKEVSAVQDKLTGLRDKYLEKTGNNQLFDIENVQKTNDEIKKVTGKISELRANTGRSSYNFDANLDVLNNMYNTLEKNVKGYYKLETEQRKTSELYQKQDKDLQMYLLDIQKIKDNTLSPNGRNKLLDENNIKTVSGELNKVENILNAILKGHEKGDIIPKKVFDDIDVRLAKINSNISSFSNQDAAAKNVQSQLDSLNRVEQKVKDLKITYQDTFTKKGSIAAFEMGLEDIYTELERLKGKAGEVRQEEMTGLNNLVTNLKRTASMLADNEKQQQKTTDEYKKQKYHLDLLRMAIDQISNSALKGKNPLVNTENISDAQKKIKGLSSFVDKLYKDHKQGNIISTEQFDEFDLKIRKATQSLKDMKDEEALIEKRNQAYQKQNKFLQENDILIKNIERSLTRSDGKNILVDQNHIDTINQKLKDAKDILDQIRTADQSKDILPVEVFNKFDIKLKEINGDIKEFKDVENIAKQATKNTESQLNTLNSYEEKIKNLKANYLKTTGANYISDESNRIAALEKIALLTGNIDRMKISTASNTEKEYRELLNEYNAVERLVKGYHNIEVSQKKNNESLRKQTNDLNSYFNELTKINRTTLNTQTGKGLTDAKHISDIRKQYSELFATVNSFKTKVKNGAIIDLEEMDKLSAKFDKLKQDIYVFEKEEAYIKQIVSDINTGERNRQSQLNTVASMYQQLDKLQAQYLGQGGSSKLFDVNNVNDVTSRLTNLYNMLGTFKVTAGNITDAEMRHYKELAGDLQILAQRYYNLEKAGTAEEKSLLTQKYTIEDYVRVLRKINETTLNPNSSKALVDPNNIANVKMQYDDLEKIILRIQSDNVNGKIIPQEQLSEANSKIKDLTQNIEILRGEEHKTFDADTSQARMLLDIGLQAEKLKTFILSLQQSNLYTGTLKQEVDALAISLANIKTPKELDHLKNTFATVQEKAKQAGLTMKSSIMSEELAQKIKIFSAQVTGYMNQNTKAAQMFGYQFQNIKNGINSITRDSDLTRLQNEFKLLQQNINNAGKTGMTFGERISGAVKKFLMWTGMTNTVMYLVRSIRQMITHTKELDSAMTFLKRVTDETDTAYNRMFDNAIRKAKDLSSSVKDIINSTAEFAKLGFNSKEAEKLAEATTVYARVGQLDINDATESIVSTLSGFKDLNTDDIWKIVDEFDNIGNKFAISSGGIGEALKRSAASLSESNNSLEESIALITTANSVVNLCHLAIVI